MKLSQARKEISGLIGPNGRPGMTIKKTKFGDYQVAFSEYEQEKRCGFLNRSPEDSAYYTSDLDDAVGTAKALWNTVPMNFAKKDDNHK